MKRLVVLLCSALFVAGCGEDVALWGKHFASSVIGLKRTVTLYAYDGTKITEYTGRFKIEGCGTHCNGFILDDGRKITLDGGIAVIEELP